MQAQGCQDSTLKSIPRKIEHRLNTPRSGGTRFWLQNFATSFAKPLMSRPLALGKCHQLGDKGIIYR